MISPGKPFVVKSRASVPIRSTILRAGMDAAALILSFYVSVFVAGYISTLIGSTPINMDYIRNSERTHVYLLLTGFLIFLFFSKGHYTSRLPWWSQVQFVTSAIAFTLIIDGFTSFALELYFSRLLIPLNWAFAFVFILIGRSIAYRLQKNAAYWQMPTVIIGDTSTVSDVLYALNADRSTGYAPHTVYLRGRNLEEFSLETIPARYRSMNIEEGNQDCVAFIKANPQNFYIISLESFRGEGRDEVIRALNQSNVRYAIIPTIGGVSLYDMEPRYFFGHDVMFLHSKAIASPVGKIGKRAMDITLSSIALVGFLPVFGIIAMMLKLEGQGGTAFYNGERLGKGGKIFKCWKFRSMEPDTDHLLDDYFQANPDMRLIWDVYHKLPNDPRVQTRTARFIRKSSLDEIPQLWNVLKGDMSLVGPRPILEREQADYGDQIDAYIQVKPGITGLWQVSGRNAVSFQRRIYWDNWYVRNWSLWGDIVIILKTIPVVVSRSDAS